MLLFAVTYGAADMTPEAFLTAPRAAVRWWDYLVPGRARRLQREIDASEAALVAAFVKSQFPFPEDSIERASITHAKISELTVTHAKISESSIKPLHWPEPTS